MAETTSDKRRRGAESLKLIGGLIALGSGLLVIGAIAAVAIIVNHGSASSIATSIEPDG